MFFPYSIGLGSFTTAEINLKEGIAEAVLTLFAEALASLYTDPIGLASLLCAAFIGNCIFAEAFVTLFAIIFS